VIAFVHVTRQVQTVSLVELKKLAERSLSRTSLLRDLILVEPDYLPREIALAKVEIFVKLLYVELNNIGS